MVKATNLNVSDLKVEAEIVSTDTVAKESIVKKLVSIMSEIEWLDKEAEVKIGGRTAYNYTTEAQFIGEIRPLMVKHGVIMIPVAFDEVVVQEKPGQKPAYLTTIVVTYRFIDSETGQYIDTKMAGQGADSNDKGIFKALTGAYKYCMRQVFLMGTGDDPEATDTNGQSVSKRKASPPMVKIINVAKKKNIDLLGEPYKEQLWDVLNVDIAKVGMTKEDVEFAAKVKKMVQKILGGQTPDDAIKEFLNS